jgi:RNA polymerase sigma factor (TIGR02999 family)
MRDSDGSDATALLLEWGQGDEEALERLLPLVYDELHRLAAGYLRRERQDHTLQATALVNEAYLRLVDQRRVEWRNTLQFVGIAAQMMRRILIDHARGHRMEKRGGDARKVSLEKIPQIAEEKAPEILAVDQALKELAREAPELARLVELRYFGGLKNEEVAELLEVSVPTVVRRWRLARAWLFRYLSGEESHGH